MANGLVRAILERTLGISRQRVMPKFTSQPFTSWFKKHVPKVTPKTGGKIVLFNDTFNTYNTPNVAISATEVSKAASATFVRMSFICPIARANCSESAVCFLVATDKARTPPTMAEHAFKFSVCPAMSLGILCWNITTPITFAASANCIRAS